MKYFFIIFEQDFIFEFRIKAILLNRRGGPVCPPASLTYVHAETTDRMSKFG